MKRAAIALGWLGAMTIPVVLALVYSFGCCVLPFHNVLHRVLPLCSLANALSSHALPDGDDGAIPPAQRHHRPAHRAFVPAGGRSHFNVPFDSVLAWATRADASHRTFISHGAARCDHDTGQRLQLLVLLRI
jgi:hypothetical protein